MSASAHEAAHALIAAQTRRRRVKFIQVDKEDITGLTTFYRQPRGTNFQDASVIRDFIAIGVAGTLSELMVNRSDFEWRMMNDEDRLTIDTMANKIPAIFGKSVDDLVNEIADDVMDVLWREVELLSELSDAIRDVGRMEGRGFYRLYRGEASALKMRMTRQKTR